MKSNRILNEKTVKRVFNAILEEWLFLVGTLVIATTWYIQTFGVSKFHEAIGDYQTRRSEFELCLVHLKQDGAYFRLLYREINVSKLDSLDAIRNLFNSTLNTYDAVIHLNVDSIDENLHHQFYNRVRHYSDSMNMTVNVKSYLGLVSTINRYLNDSMRIYQDKGERYRKRITTDYERTSRFYLGFLILGTLLITINKGLKYLSSK